MDFYPYKNFEEPKRCFEVDRQKRGFARLIFRERIPQFSLIRLPGVLTT
jgi:hypothetical protein